MKTLMNKIIIVGREEMSGLLPTAFYEYHSLSCLILCSFLPLLLVGCKEVII
jgi:hypothetical protein